MAPARCDVSIEGLSRVSDLVMVGLLLIRACSSLRLVDSGRIGYRLRCPIAPVARRLIVKPGLSSMPLGRPPWSTTSARQGDRKLEAASGPRGVLRTVSAPDRPRARRACGQRRESGPC